MTDDGKFLFFDEDALRLTEMTYRSKILRIHKIEVKAERELTIIDDGRFNDVFKSMHNSDRLREPLLCIHNVKEENFVTNIVKEIDGLNRTDDVKNVIVKFKHEPQLDIFDEYENIPVIVYEKHVVRDCIKRNTTTECNLASTTPPSSSEILQESVFSQKNVTGDINSFKCYICHQMFVNKESLIQHIEFHGHRNKHSFQCNNQPIPTASNKFPIVKLVDCLKINGDITNGKFRTSMSKESNDSDISERNGILVRRFECYICKRMFIKSESLSMHLIESHPCEDLSTNENEMHDRTDKVEKRYACTYPQCHRNYKYKYDLVTHTITHTDDKKYFCDYADCNGTFFTSKALSMHRRIHSDERKYVCTYEQCGKKFKLRNYLREHENIHSTGAKPHVCKYANCGKAFFKKSKLTRHYLTHTIARRFSCNYLQCEKKFKDETALKKHLATHTSERIHGCTFPQCEKKFTTKILLNLHLARHKNDKPYACTHTGCGKKFQEYSNLQRHKKGHVENRPRPFVCSVPQCGKSFALKGNFKAHSFSHVVDRTYECVQCGKKYKSKRDLQKHKRSHSDAKPHACNYEKCGKSFKSKGELTNHKLVHSDQRPFPCTHPECNKTFKTSSQLSAHRLTHSLARPFACAHVKCGKKFKTKVYLKEHQRIHLGEKKYECAYPGCDGKFTSKSYLVVHNRYAHSGERPCICSYEQYCGMKFKSNKSLRSHFRRHSS